MARVAIRFTTRTVCQVVALPLTAMIRPVPMRCGVSSPSDQEASEEGSTRTAAVPVAGLPRESVEYTGTGTVPAGTVVTCPPWLTTTLVAGPAPVAVV